MKPKDTIERSIREFTVRTNASTDRRILTDATEALRRFASRALVERTHNSFLGRTVMRNGWTKMATAAAILVAAGVLLVTVSDKVGATAYALDQTVQASHSVRTLHLKDYKAGVKEPKEFWVRFDGRGELVCVRLEFPAWSEGGDGRKVVVWKNGKAQVWFKDKKTSVIVGDQRVAEQFTGLIQKMDPKQIMQSLKRDEKAGKVSLEIREPSKRGDPIVMVATFKPDNIQRWVVFIDPKTKLMTKVDYYQRVKDQYERVGWGEFLGYNEPIPDSTFTLKLPPGTILVDQTRQDVGLVQGKLSKDEIARKVVREFFDALIAKDYARAGRMMGGIPADGVQKFFSKLHVVRIVSIGKPEPHPKTGGLRVPTVLEVDNNGTKSNWSPHGPFVRQVYNQPERWEVIGGI